MDDAQTRHHVPCTLLCPIMGIYYSPFTHHFLPMICQIIRPCLACFGSYLLAHSQYEGHTCWVLFPAEFSEYFIVGEWFGQAVDADITEIEDASYFHTFSETTVGKVVEGEVSHFDKEFRTRVLTTPLPTHLCCFLLPALLINQHCHRKDQGMGGYRQRSLRGNPQTYIAHTQTLSCKATMSHRPLASHLLLCL